MCLTQVSGHPCPIKAADLTQGSWGASTVHSINIDCYVLSLSLSFLPSPTFSFFHSFPISLLAASVTSTQLWPSPGNKPHTTCACYTKETTFLFVLEKTWLKATEIKQTIIFFFHCANFARLKSKQKQRTRCVFYPPLHYFKERRKWLFIFLQFKQQEESTILSQNKGARQKPLFLPSKCTWELKIYLSLKNSLIFCLWNHFI